MSCESSLVAPVVLTRKEEAGVNPLPSHLSPYPAAAIPSCLDAPRATGLSPSPAQLQCFYPSLPQAMPHIGRIYVAPLLWL